MGYRYIGAKTQIIDEVLKAIQRIVGNDAVVADIMCGTAAVSAALRRRGYTVIANDVMTYSYHHARVALKFAKEPAFNALTRFLATCEKPVKNPRLFPASQYERTLTRLNDLPERRGYFWREFSPAGRPANGERPRNYFTADNAMKIDAIRFAIRKFREQKLTTDLEHSLLMHDLLMAVNDVANIAGTYGHYLSKTVDRAKQPLALTPANLMFGKDAGDHRVYKGYAEVVARKIVCDLVYIDPPYMKRQYAANYHVLETIARGDEPEAFGVSGLRPWRDQYSNFCTKTKIQSSFRKILTNIKSQHFLISYSEDGLLGIDELRSLFGEIGEVRIHSISNKRFKSNDSLLAPKLTEYLIHVEKKPSVK